MHQCVPGLAMEVQDAQGPTNLKHRPMAASTKKLASGAVTSMALDHLDGPKILITITNTITITVILITTTIPITIPISIT